MVGLAEVKYFGPIFTPEDLKYDLEKVRAIWEMQPPRDKSELKTILGMITYWSGYAPNLSEIMQPLADILKKDVLFHLDEPQICVFQKDKEILIECPRPTPSYFDPKLVTSKMTACNMVVQLC